MPDVMVLRDNGDGTYLGADDAGNLYDGLIHEVTHADLDVETTLTDDGFERVSSYMGMIHGKGNMSRAAFDAARPDMAQEDLDAAWQAEVDITHHEVSYYQTPDGPVPVTLRFLVWTVR